MASLRDDLHKYTISRDTGFVPEKGSRALPFPFQPWEDLAASLPQLLKHPRSLIAEVARLPVLPTDKLDSEAKWQRAYVVLAFLVHGYCHGCRQKVVPLPLSEPFLSICKHLDIETALTYAGLCLYNWTEGSSEDELGLRSSMSFTGTLDESAFYLTPVLVERSGGRLASQLLQAIDDAAKSDWASVVRHLESCNAALKAMIEALNGLKLCKPDTFYHQVRPYLAGLEVSFERRNDLPLQVKVAGGSAVQAPLFQFLDRILGVSHGDPILNEMRPYMAGGHRRFLERVDELPSLLDWIKSNGADETIRLALDACYRSLTEWRNKHIAIVTRYVMLPAQAAVRMQDGNTIQVAGTAGSSPVLFLKQIRNETRQHLEDNQRKGR